MQLFKLCKKCTPLPNKLRATLNPKTLNTGIARRAKVALIGSVKALKIVEKLTIPTEMILDLTHDA
jgi:hypothetical protein